MYQLDVPRVVPTNVGYPFCNLSSVSSYRYYKRSEERNSEAWMILRESLDNPFDLECWRVDHWESAIDLWWQTRQEYDYWDINKGEAMREIPRLSERQRASQEAREREMAEAREKILKDRQAERERRNELDDWTRLERAAIALHEMFTTLSTAGFSEEQALKLVSQILTQTSGQDV